MKRIILISDNRFKHWDLTGNHPDAIIVEDKIAFDLSQDTEHKQYDINTKKIRPFKKPFVLVDAKNIAIARLQSARDNAIIQPVVSSALGSSHTYSVVAENRNFLNNLITLGIDSKFTCTDSNGVKMRRLHTLSQLMTLGLDVEAVISAHFDHYELKLTALLTAKTQAGVDKGVW